MHPKHRKLNEAIGNLIDDYGLVSFLPLDVTEEDSITLLMAEIDNAIQYAENQEVKEMNDQDPDFEDEH